MIVVDEASMLDWRLAAALLAACQDGAHLLVVATRRKPALDRDGYVLECPSSLWVVR